MPQNHPLHAALSACGCVLFMACGGGTSQSDASPGSDGGVSADAASTDGSVDGTTVGAMTLDAMTVGASADARSADGMSANSSSTDAAGGNGADVGASRNAAPLLRVSSNKRYLVDPNDRPFYLVGDTAWCLIPGLTASEANTYFESRASQGFNAVLMDADVQLGASPVGAPERGPADANGNNPFNGTLPGGAFDVSTVPAQGDTTSTAAKYWANVDAIISAASRNGIEIIFDVFDNYSPWFGNGGSPNSTDKLTAYGQFLGERYASFDNIIWMLGNDYNESSTGDANFAAVMHGIRQYDTRHLGWALDEVGAAFDNTGLKADFSLDSIYEYSTGPWRTVYLAQYGRSDFGPIINIESGYENNTSLGVSEADLREEHYSFLLSGRRVTPTATSTYGRSMTPGRIGRAP